nr:uncharacterized protein LOC126533504 [Dermacentor andersoni]
MAHAADNLTEVFVVTSRLQGSVVGSAATLMGWLTSPIPHQTEAYRHWGLAFRHGPETPGQLLQVVDAGPHPASGRIVASTTYQTMEELRATCTSMSATRPTTAITVRLVGPKQRGANLPVCPRLARHPGRLQQQQSWARNIMAHAGAGLTEVYLVTSDLQATKTALGASVLRRATSMVANQRRSFTHWAVAFRYPPPGPLYEVHEAGPHPVTGRVIAMRSFQTFEEINNESSEVRSLGSYPLTKEAVNKAVEHLADLGQYQILSMNCQEFIRKLLLRLNLPLPKEFVTAENAVLEAAVRGTIMSAAASALCPPRARQPPSPSAWLARSSAAPTSPCALGPHVTPAACSTSSPGPATS